MNISTWTSLKKIAQNRNQKVMKHKKGRKCLLTSSDSHIKKKVNPVAYNHAKKPVEPEVEVMAEMMDDDKDV